jgi:hypothetical protein
MITVVLALYKAKEQKDAIQIAYLVGAVTRIAAEITGEALDMIIDGKCKSRRQPGGDVCT